MQEDDNRRGGVTDRRQVEVELQRPEAHDLSIDQVVADADA
jgi:hypothetical protein